MFDNFKAMAALGGMMKDLPRIKERIAEVKERLAGMEITGTSADGLVTVIVNGKFEVLSLAWNDPETDNDGSPPSAESIVEAINDALRCARARAAEEMRALAEKLDLPIPQEQLSGLLD